MPTCSTRLTGILIFIYKNNWRAKQQYRRKHGKHATIGSAMAVLLLMSLRLSIGRLACFYGSVIYGVLVDSIFVYGITFCFWSNENGHDVFGGRVQRFLGIKSRTRHGGLCSLFLLWGRHFEGILQVESDM